MPEFGVRACDEQKQPVSAPGSQISIPNLVDGPLGSDSLSNSEWQAWLLKVLEEHRQQSVVDIKQCCAELVNEVKDVRAWDVKAYDLKGSKAFCFDTENSGCASNMAEKVERRSASADNDDIIMTSDSFLDDSDAVAHDVSRNGMTALDSLQLSDDLAAAVLEHKTGVYTEGVKDPDEHSSAIGMAHAMLVRNEMAAMGATSKRTYNRMFLDTAVKLAEWIGSLREPKRTGRLADMIYSTLFESICGFVILVNSGFVAWTADWEMQHMASGATSGTPQSFAILEWIFLAWYLIELCLRILVHRLYFFINVDMRWNVFDTLLVVISTFDLAVTTFMDHGGGEGGNVAFMRILRLLKIAKVLRTLRALRLFKDLAVMVDSFRTSFVALFWAVIMVSVILYIFALVFIQGLAGYLNENGDSVDRKSRQMVIEYFGTMPRSMLSLYEACTGGEDWGKYYEVVATAGSLYAGFFVAFTFFQYFAVFTILTGIFVEKAMCAATPDRDDLVLEHRRQVRKDMREFKHIVSVLDPRKTGTISWQDFEKAMHNEIMVAYLASIGLEIHEVRLFFQVITGDRHAERVDIDHFVEGCMHMKGGASGIDMQLALFQIHTLQTDLKNSQKEIQRLLHLEPLIHNGLYELLLRFRELSDHFSAGGSKVVPKTNDSNDFILVKSMVASL